jgi:putative membrane protein
MLASLALLLHFNARIGWTIFTVHPSTVVGLGLLAALYTWRARRGRTEGQPPLGKAKPALFATALVVMFLSLNGWLHDLSDAYLFSAHMVQHLLLALVVAPFLVMGTPGWMLRPALRIPLVRAIATRITHPFFCFLSFSIVVAAWHLPVMYNAALASHPLHIVQHLTFLVTSVLMWWPVLSPMPELPRISYPLQMLYLFLMSITMSIVSICIAYADEVLYPAYASAPRIWGISPMSDQMLGALIMWVPGGLFFFTIISVIFFRWQAQGGLDSADSAQVGYRPAASMH